MASELSSFIEKELARKGYDAVDLEEAEGGGTTALMGALRVEARVKEQESARKLFNLRRSVCVGGGALLVVLVAVVLIAGGRREGARGSGMGEREERKEEHAWRRGWDEMACC